MTTNLDLDAGLQNANTVFQSLRDQLYAEILPGPYQMYSDVIPVATGLWENHFLSNHPQMRQWVGARQEKAFRHYSEALEAVAFEATLPIKRKLISRDKTGAVGKALGVFARNNTQAYDRTAAAAFDGSAGAGPTGFDGVSLFNASHPHVNSGAGHSNIAAGTNFSHAAFTAARAAMRKFKFENGEPAYIVPTLIRVGNDLEQRVKDVLEARDRKVTVDASGAEATAAVVAATSIENVWMGELDVLIDQRVGAGGSGGFFWTLIDARKPDNKPMTLIEERRPVAINRTDMTDPRRFEFDEFVYGLEGDWQVGAGQWMTCYRGTGTA